MNKMRLLALLVSLIAVFSLCFIGCTQTDTQTSITSGNVTDGNVSDGNVSDGDAEAVITLTVDVQDADGNIETFTVETDADNLADALLGAALVEGEDGAYGLYIKTVNGIRADYELDGAYWALYCNGEMLMSGANDTAIADGEHYELVYTAG